MSNVEIIITVFAGIILFLFGLENFSKEIKLISGDAFRKFIAKWTKNHYIGLVLGTVITAIVQSSTATSVITVSLVNSGVISFTNSLGLIFGANIGSSVTSQLVAFQVMGYAPIFILIGFLMGLVKTKYSFLAKSIFYFGFVFFSLNLISNALAPMKDNPFLIELVQQTNTVAWGLLIGFIFTVVVNSSSVTMGILIILAQQNLIGIEQALPIILGSKVGTTITAAVSSMGMSQAAKKTAAAHVLYNLGGVAIFLPFLQYSDLLYYFSKEPGQILANALLIFNVSSAVFFLIIIKQFKKVIDYIIKEEGEVIRQPFTDVEIKTTSIDNLKDFVSEIEYTYSLFEEAYMNCVVGIEAHHIELIEKANKIRNMIDFYQKEIHERMIDLSKEKYSDLDAELLIKVFQSNEYLKNLVVYIDNFSTLFNNLESRKKRLSLKMIFSVRAITQTVVPLLRSIGNDMKKADSSESLNKQLSDFERVSFKENDLYLKRLLRNDLTSGSFFIDFLTHNSRMINELLEFKKKIIHIKKKIENKPVENE